MHNRNRKGSMLGRGRSVRHTARRVLCHDAYLRHGVRGAVDAAYPPYYSEVGSPAYVCLEGQDSCLIGRVVIEHCSVL